MFHWFLQGGTLVGAEVAGRRVLIVDDVITAGTAIREAMAMLTAAHAHVVGVVVCLDRQETASVAESVQESAAAAPLSAVAQVHQEYEIPVLSVVCLDHLVAYAREQRTANEEEEGGGENDPHKWSQAMESYRAKYGVPL